MDKKKLLELSSFMAQKGFVWGPSPEIYGGLSGFYTYGPLGKLLKNNIENEIRSIFQKHNFFEVECPIILPKQVWEASGHLAGFSDPIIICSKCKSSFRVDNLIAEKFEDAALKESEYLNFIKEKSIKCPSCGSDFVMEIKKHNLMMKTTVGLDTEAYCRPETATTTYLPFIRINDFFREKLPYGVFQIGKVFRNEISPRQYLLRLREFTQAEAQLFVHPKLKNEFPAFEKIAKSKLPLWDWKSQEAKKELSKVILADALKKGFIKNKAYGYAIHLTYEMFRQIGIPEERIRLRQHGPEEKAFYADDAWDVEVKLNTFGWSEICGVHDRTDYDLKQHSKFSGKKLEMNAPEGGKIVPHVIEIAFGIDRPLFAVLDIYYERKEEEEGKSMLKVPVHLAPIKVNVFPLFKKDGMPELALKIFDELKEHFICKYDETQSIGKRYLRAAEEGTPFCITVDYDSLKNKDVTIRERDSEKQVRVKIKDLVKVLTDLMAGKKFKELK